MTQLHFGVLTSYKHISFRITNAANKRVDPGICEHCGDTTFSIDMLDNPLACKNENH